MYHIYIFISINPERFFSVNSFGFFVVTEARKSCSGVLWQMNLDESSGVVPG